MSVPLVLASILLAAAPAPADIAAYEAAAVRAHRDPEAQVRLALWCEAHGLQAEKVKHLALAVLIDPSDAAARGLLGLVSYGGKWRRPEAVADKARADAALAAALAEYNVRRSSLKNTAEAHWHLALWCEGKGLKPEATAHLSAVVRLDPGREAAWKRLGYKRHGGRWATDAQLAAEKAEREAQKQANRHWLTRLARWRDQLGEPGKRHEAEQALTAVADPRAVPAAWSVFATGNPRRQLVAVRLLGQIESPGSSRALAWLSVLSGSAEVRRQATETLRSRDPRDWVGDLVALLRDPIKYKVQPVAGPGSTGTLTIEGKRANLVRRYSPPLPAVAMLPGDSMTLDANGLPVLDRPLGPVAFSSGQDLANGLEREVNNLNPISHVFMQRGQAGIAQDFRALASAPSAELSRVRQTPALNALNAHGAGPRPSQTPFEYEQIPVGLMMLAAQETAVLAQQQLAGDVQQLEASKAAVAANNARVLAVLEPLTGQELGEDPEAWSRWLTDLKGYAVLVNTSSQPTPTLVEDIPLATVSPPPTTIVLGDAPAGFIPVHSCFAAGTPVQTFSGPRPIETVRLGDRVLTEDTTTGALSYQPVLVAYHNPPNATCRVTLEGETIVVTGIHRFWKAGRGWVMARDLAPGDVVRTVGGSARVESVAAGSVLPVFNLEVAEGRSFFVGKRGLLVHDNSPVESVYRRFDGTADLAPGSAGRDAE